MFTIYYTAPYTGQRRTQSFRTREEAESMAAFYRSCGSKSGLIWHSYPPLTGAFTTGAF